MPVTSHAQAAAALETLADYFDRDCYSTTLLTGHNRVPRLTIISRGAGLAYDIYADQGWFWSGEPAQLAPLDDPGAVAHDVRYMVAGPGTGAATRRRALLAAIRTAAINQTRPDPG